MTSIPEEQGSDKAAWRGWTWLEWGILALTAALCLGLGILVGKQDAAGKSPDNRLWIEQLPASELPGAIGTSTPPAAANQNSSSVSAGLGTSQAAAAAAAVSASVAHNYVASKTGSKYYTPDCAAAKRIKEQIKVWFATKQAAEAAGLTPSTSCKGL
jgi:hypothetical protein